MQRLGWLLISLIIFLQSVPLVYAISIPSSQVGNELKMTPQTVRVRLSNLGRFLTIKGNSVTISLAMSPSLGNVKGEVWMVDCKTSQLMQPATGRSRKIPRSGILIESLSGFVSINDRHYSEQMVIYPQELLSPYDSSIRNNSECLVVNHIGIEKYLESVVNGEFNSQWAESAVEAQVIAARTYALFQMKETRKTKGKVFDVESTQKDQVYLGMDRVDAKATEIVKKTKGMIMVAKSSNTLDPIKAFYHATCGGQTLLPEQVWGNRFAGFTRGAPCPYCAHSPSFEWDYKINLSDLAQRTKNGLKVDVKKWMLIAVRSASFTSQHVKEVLFEFANKEIPAKRLQLRVDAYQFRNWVDPAKLKSTLFDIQLLGSNVMFKGKGSGHAVGMCQWGAKHMGEKGLSREQILTHYYPGAKLARLWN